MARKKKNTTPGNADFDNNPFRDLKGFAVSTPGEKVPSTVAPPLPPVEERSFDEEMDFLGVKPLPEREEVVRPEPRPSSPGPVAPAAPQSDAELFLASLGQLDVRFADQLPEEQVPAQPRRMKALRQGRLRLDAELDLHGLQRHEVAEKLRHFLQNAAHHQWQTLLVVTGRGLHSEAGRPVLREEVERLLRLEGQGQVAEWGRAPRRFGGEGALVLFLKQKPTGEL